MGSHQSKRKFDTILQLDFLPSLPDPSPRLLDLIEKSNSNTTKLAFKSAKLKLMKKRKMNGFMAFRSYYSSLLRSLDCQRELLSTLATLWKEEYGKNVWRFYAVQYNEHGGEEAFSTWLNRRLKGGRITRAPTLVHKKYEGLLYENVEDVFIEKESLN